jgi:hypothetical protein
MYRVNRNGGECDMYRENRNGKESWEGRGGKTTLKI